MIDHVKRLNDWTTFTCHMYNSKYCKVFIIVCCNMQSKDGATQILFWENLNLVMADNGVLNVNFKGFMVDTTQANWIADGITQKQMGEHLAHGRLLCSWSNCQSISWIWSVNQYFIQGRYCILCHSW